MASKNSNPMRTALRRQIKKLRSDARKLEVIASHLRLEAKELAAGIKADERAEKARTNFFSKPANIDKDLTLTPDIPAVCPYKVFRDWPECFEDCDHADKAECPHKSDKG